MDHELVLDLEYDLPERAELIERSLRPEVGDIEGDRTAADLDRDGAVLTITVTAADLVALRAGLNTWLSLADVAETVDAAAGPPGTGADSRGDDGPGPSDESDAGA